MAADDERPRPGADPRTLALSDGVFAIAMTLLVLSTGMPRPGEHEHLGSALWHHNAERFSWLLSFAVLGKYGIRSAAIGLYAVTTALLSLAIPLSLLVGGWALLLWLLLPLARRA
jgi:Endosomal/lysosomal potassium channel TMEM175